MTAVQPTFTAASSAWSRAISVRTLLRLDGVASLAAGVVALELGDVLAVVVLLVLGVDALAVSAFRRRFVATVTAFAVLREVALLAVFASGLSDGLGRADLVLAGLVVEAVVLGLIEVRTARRAG